MSSKNWFAVFFRFFRKMVFILWHFIRWYTTSYFQEYKIPLFQSSSKGRGTEVIQSLEISADNYVEQMLKNQYDKRLIIQKHFKTLFKLPLIVKENHAKLRQLVDSVLRNLWALITIGRPIDSWDDILLHLVTGKLDITTNKEWENTTMTFPHGTCLPSFWIDVTS